MPSKYEKFTVVHPICGILHGKPMEWNGNFNLTSNVNICYVRITLKCFFFHIPSISLSNIANWLSQNVSLCYGLFSIYLKLFTVSMFSGILMHFISQFLAKTWGSCSFFLPPPRSICFQLSSLFVLLSVCYIVKNKVLIYTLQHSQLGITSHPRYYSDTEGVLDGWECGHGLALNKHCRHLAGSSCGL